MDELLMENVSCSTAVDRLRIIDFCDYFCFTGWGLCQIGFQFQSNGIWRGEDQYSTCQVQSWWWHVTWLAHFLIFTTIFSLPPVGLCKYCTKLMHVYILNICTYKAFQRLVVKVNVWYQIKLKWIAYFVASHCCQK